MPQVTDIDIRFFEGQHEKSNRGNIFLVNFSAIVPPAQAGVQ
jgi:hypothetical protein